MHDVRAAGNTLQTHHEADYQLIQTATQTAKHHKGSMLCRKCECVLPVFMPLVY
jgi:hypothetical protein